MEFLLCAAQIDAHRAYEMGLVNAVGTYQYLAPERLGNSPDDARADIYALQCVLYECLTGAPPFAGQTMAGLVAPHSSTSPPQPSIAKPGVPQRLDQVIATGMAKHPERRYPTAIELAATVQDAEPHLPVSEVDPARLEARLRVTCLSPDSRTLHMSRSEQITPSTSSAMTTVA